MLLSGSRPSVDSLASRIISWIVLDRLSDSFSAIAWSSRGTEGPSVCRNCADAVPDQACARYASIPSWVVNRWVVRSGMGTLSAGFTPGPSFLVERVHSALAERMHSASTESLDSVSPGLDRRCWSRRHSISLHIRLASTYWSVCPAIMPRAVHRCSANSKRLV